MQAQVLVFAQSSMRFLIFLECYYATTGEKEKGYKFSWLFKFSRPNKVAARPFTEATNVKSDIFVNTTITDVPINV